MRKNLLVCLLLFFLSLEVWGQEIPLGSWRSHLNYSESKLIVHYSGKVYVASRNGLFYFDPQDNSINKITKNDGLGDVGITAMAATPDGNKLIIGYSSGHIDILENQLLTSINTIRITNEYEDKSINHIVFYNEFAYLSTGFGLVAFNFVEGEVIESYGNIGENGSRLEAQSASVLQDSIYLATPDGIISTSLSASNNLLDFRNWYRFKNNESYPDADVQYIATFNNKIYAGFENDGLYHYDDHNWEKIDFPPVSQFKRIKTDLSFLYVISGNQNNGHIFRLDAENQYEQLSDDKTMIPSDLITMENNDIWVADEKLGLVVDLKGTGENFYPDGPVSDDFNELLYFEDKIAAIEKGIDEDFVGLDKPAFLSIFTGGRWQNYIGTNTPFLLGIKDFTDLAYNPQSKEVFVSTFGSGILKFNVNNDPVFSLIDGNEGSSFLSDKITALASTEDGSWWIAEYNNQDKIYNLSNSQWKSFTLASEEHVLEILNDPYGNIWLRLTSGILVLNPDTGATVELSAGNSQLINSTVTTFAFDKNGFLWYGTPVGVAYISNPGDVFEGAVTNVVPLFQGANLLKNQTIGAIEIDPANRKWIATAAGLWLFSEDADSLLYQFAEENSPLTSNSIMDIEINPNSGEVYIATTKGLVSYRSNATEGKESHDQVKIFPNPVKSNYTGTIGIIGVVEGAIVKITDLAGNLVKEINAEGGTAIWDGNTLSGDRAKSGIYLIFSSSADGKETFIGKLAFLN